MATNYYGDRGALSDDRRDRIRANAGTGGRTAMMVPDPEMDSRIQVSLRNRRKALEDSIKKEDVLQKMNLQTHGRNITAMEIANRRNRNIGLDEQKGFIRKWGIQDAEDQGVGGYGAIGKQRANNIMAQQEDEDSARIRAKIKKQLLDTGQIGMDDTANAFAQSVGIAQLEDIVEDAQGNTRWIGKDAQGRRMAIDLPFDRLGQMQQATGRTGGLTGSGGAVDTGRGGGATQGINKTNISYAQTILEQALDEDGNIQKGMEPQAELARMLLINGGYIPPEYAQEVMAVSDKIGISPSTIQALTFNPGRQGPVMGKTTYLDEVKQELDDMLGDGGGAITVPEGAEPSTYWRDKGIVGGAVEGAGKGLINALVRSGMAVMRPDVAAKSLADLLPKGLGEKMYGTDYDLQDIQEKGQAKGEKAAEAVRTRWEKRQREKNMTRPDGTKKDVGFLGVLNLPNGGTTSEYSVQSDAVKVNGKMIDFPTLVPTLTKEQLDVMVNDIIPNNKPIPEPIMQKAIAHAKKRISEGKGVFFNSRTEYHQNEIDQRAGVLRAMPANDPIRMQLEALLGVPLKDATDEELVEVFDSL